MDQSQGPVEQTDVNPVVYVFHNKKNIQKIKDKKLGSRRLNSNENISYWKMLIISFSLNYIH